MMRYPRIQVQGTPVHKYVQNLSNCKIYKEYVDITSRIYINIIFK